MHSFLFSRRFWPLFVTQFLGALNDNLFKNALILLVTFRLSSVATLPASLMAPLAAGLFILPFFLFSAVAGQVADKYNRARIARLIKMAEIAIMAVASVGFVLPNVNLLLAALFCMGLHSTFFGPVKYALLPQHLKSHELLEANSYVEASTFVAILIGTIVGGFLALQPSGPFLTGVATLVIAAMGYVASCFIPAAPGAAPETAISPHFLKETWRICSATMARAALVYPVLLISWFWFVGATYLSLLPSLVKDGLKQDESYVMLLLTGFSAGICLGSLAAVNVFKNRARAGLFTAGAVAGMAVFGADFFFSVASDSMRLFADFAMISVCGGIFAVPLYTHIQRVAPAEFMARTVAAMNIISALFMALSSVLIMVLAKVGITATEMLWMLSAANAVLSCAVFLKNDCVFKG